MKRSKLAFECPTSINNFEFANQFMFLQKKYTLHEKRNYGETGDNSSCSMLLKREILYKVI